MKSFFIPIIITMLMPVFFQCQSDSGRVNSDDLPNPEDLILSWENRSNFIAENNRHEVVFTLENQSEMTLGERGWALFFNQSPRMPVPGASSPEIRIEHINGDWFTLQPEAGFSLPSGETITLTAEFEGSLIKRTDAPLGVYFVFYDEADQEIGRVPVENYTIKPFTEPEQINRSPGDETPIPSPEWQYEQNQNLSLLDQTALYPVIPVPASLNGSGGTVSLKEGLMIHHQEGLEKEAELLAESLSSILSSRPMVMASTVSGPNIISLKTGDVSVNGTSAEAYSLEIGDQGVVITGSDPAGVFYGTRSLISLCPVKALSDPGEELILDKLSMRDAPAFGYRGIHLDLARNFQKKETVLKLIDAIAFYKLNTLHLHLTDDEGWRLEIEELPELTELGGFRGHGYEEDEYLHPAYGSGPFPDPETSHGNGYLSREEFKEILVYAHERHVEIIPEVNMPGHARAAIKAMQARYRRLMKEGKVEEAEAYLLSEESDSSEYFSAQWYDDNVICVCKEPAYRFYETVVDDIIEMYEEAGVPLTTIHTGGDEVPRGVWEKSPLCQAFLAENPGIGDARNLQAYFFGRIVEILEKKDLKIGGWEEVAMLFQDDGSWIANREFAGKEVIPYVWNSLWGNQDLAYRLANAGYPVVLCNVNHFYFDLAYNKDPREPGLYWGGFVNTRTAFEFIPFDLFKSMNVSPGGVPFDEQRDFKGMERLSPAGKQNILGIQAELWSETIKGQDMLEYYYLPKLLGMAQRAWQGQADWGDMADPEARKAALEADWNVFVNTIGQREFPRLDRMSGGYNYRIPPPGMRLIDGKIHANTSFPGLTLRYTTDGSEPDESALEYTGPFEASGMVKIRAFNTRNQAGRTSSIMVE